jgi:nitroreductase
VSVEDLGQIVKCGQYAANGMGLQPWHFTVVQNKVLLDRISEEYRKIIADPKIGAGRRGAGDPKFSCIWNAPTLVIISGEVDEILVAVDCGNAAQNMAVAATSLGIASCIVASVKEALSTPNGKLLCQELGIPDGFVPYFGLTLGYANEKPRERDPRREDSVNYVL